MKCFGCSRRIPSSERVREIKIYGKLRIVCVWCETLEQAKARARRRKYYRRECVR